MLNFRINYSFGERMKNKFKPPQDITLRESKINMDAEFLKKYDLWDYDDKDYRINCFEQIGWTDPFPKEDLFKSKCTKPTDLHYQVYKKSRYTHDVPPQTIYIPRREIMFKMMTACVGVKEIDDLWLSKKIYNEYYTND